MQKINYLKTAATKAEASNAALIRLIWGAKAQRGLSDDDLAHMLGGRSRSYVAAHKKNPGSFRIEDLRLLCAGLGITQDDLRGAIDF